MADVGRVTVECPVCGGPVEVPVIATVRPIQSIDGALLIDLSAGTFDHDCPGPRSDVALTG